MNTLKLFIRIVFTPILQSNNNVIMKPNIIKINLIIFVIIMGISQSVISQTNIRKNFFINYDMYISDEPGYTRPHIVFENNHTSTIQIEIYKYKSEAKDSVYKYSFHLEKDKSYKGLLPADYNEKDDEFISQTYLQKIVITESDWSTQTIDIGANTLGAIPVIDDKEKFLGFFAWKLVRQKDGKYRLCVRNKVKVNNPCEEIF